MSQFIPPRFLFRFAFAVPRVAEIPRKSGRLLKLPDTCRLPNLGELDSLREFADVRLAWNDNGLALSVTVNGKSQIPVYDSDAVADGIHVWLDTRATQNVHRATKYCHRFSLLPRGGRHKAAAPLAVSIPLPRAREESVPPDASLIQLQAEVRQDGYELDAWLPAEVLFGFDPASHPRLGFHYVVRDRELGDQHLSTGSEFPYESDPSLWQTIELAKST